MSDKLVTVYHAQTGQPVEVSEARADQLVNRGSHVREPLAAPAVAEAGGSVSDAGKGEAPASEASKGK